jgi:uncharacterized protein YcgL (UPF0745 family)
VARGDERRMSKRICAVYRARRNADTYLFVDHHEGLARVPPELLDTMGGTERVMTLALEPTRRLARADAAEVLAAIESRGWYLQLPPAGDAAEGTPA